MDGQRLNPPTLRVSQELNALRDQSGPGHRSGAALGGLSGEKSSGDVS